MNTLRPQWPYPGARWWKVDFHAHTPASKDWHNTTDPSPQPTAEQWLLKYMEADVDCVVIADHNSGAWIDSLKDVYERLKANPPAGFRELSLFPGVEVSVSGGFHLLAILDLDKTTCDIDQLLGKVDYDGTPGTSDGVTRKSALEVIEAVANCGLAVPAHADQPKGLLHLDNSSRACAIQDPMTLQRLFDGGRVIAAEIVNSQTRKPQIYVDAKCQWTEVLGSDSHSLHSDPLPGSRFTWVKMARPALEGLRLALLDGSGFSIRRSDDPEPFDPFKLPTHFIESIEISEARYMGRGGPQKLQFHPWFNALVGGRGTGKSTVVHALRLAFRRQGDLRDLPQESEPRGTFERFVKVPQSRSDEEGALDYRSTQKTEILVTLAREGAPYRLRWRQDATGTAVEEGVTRNWQPSQSQSVAAERFPLRMFSQGQIASLAGEDQQALLKVVDESAGTMSAHAVVEDSERRFLALRAQVRELDYKFKARDDVKVALEDVKRKLASFEGRQHAEILNVYQLRSRQNRELDRQIRRVEEIAGRLLTEARELSTEDVPQGIFDPQDSVAGEALAAIERLHAAVAEAASAVQRAGDGLAMLAKHEREVLATSAWHTAFMGAADSYAQLTEELRKQGVADPREYGELVQQRQRIEGELSRLDSLQKERDKIAALATSQRQRIREDRRTLSLLRSNFLTNTLATNPYVRIDLLPYGRDLRAIERSLREILGAMDDRFNKDILVLDDDGSCRGLVPELLHNLPVDPQSAATKIEQRLDSLGERFERACAGRGDFGGHFNNYLQGEFAKRPEILDRLLVWSPEDGLRVQYSRRGDGTDFQSIHQASAGQRAAAMLAFLLAHGVEPLVLDQPEDDLDNHLIYDLVVQQIRSNKLRRQMIVVTHNPNIVVNGDAEMLHAFDFRNGQCRVVKAGSLQEQDMRDEVCRVMEGGREAFERRYRRLGREN
jgi:DNA repair ATPase RecN